jgi:RNA polymerase sigma-70 factor (ECF subfamily)
MKKLLCLLLAVATIFACSINAFASENVTDSGTVATTELEQALIDEVCLQVVESYAEYYTIPQISGIVREIESVNGGWNYIIDVSFTKILLADDASDLPYIQGMTDAVATIEDATLKAEAQKALDTRIAELNTLYIGAEQSENSSFKVFVPGTSTRMSTSDYSVTFVSDFGEMPMAAFTPKTQDELYQEGVESLSLSSFVSTENAASTVSVNKTNPSSATDYDRLKAKAYVEKYSCGNCGMSSHSCANASYNFYASNDCANFVSQAICYAGINTESNWKPYTTTWINTGWRDDYYGLVEYMVDQGFFFETTNKYKAFAGSIIYWNQYSHVGMVNANDTVTMTFCAHTNDRNSSSFKNWTGSTEETDVKFFVPVWDSYAGAYTTQ